MMKEKSLFKKMMIPPMLALFLLLQSPALFASGPVPPAPQLETSKSVYSGGEPIVVNYSNLSDSYKNWIAVYEKWAGNNDYGEWYYTQGAANGTMKFAGLDAGCYDARLFYDDSFNLEKKANFRVVSGINKGANGIFFDADDRLYICSAFGGYMYLMDAETGEILETYGAGEGVDGPDDVEVATNGDVYYTDIVQGNVCRRNVNGAVTKQHIAIGVNSVAISADGRLFIGMAMVGDALFEVDRDLKKPPRLVVGPRGQFNGSDFGPDGRLYTALDLVGKIVSTDVDADNPETWILETDVKTVADDLLAVSGVKFNSKGEMYGSTYLGNIWKIDPATGDRELVANAPFGIDNITTDSNDRVFISNGVSGRIYEVLPDGALRTVNK